MKLVFIILLLKVSGVLFGQSLKLMLPIGHTGPISSVSFSHSNRYVLSSSWDTSIKVWSVNEGRLVATIAEQQKSVNYACFTPDDKFIISGSTDGTIILWQLSTGEMIRTFHGHKDAINSLSVSPDGLHLLSASSDNTVKLWSIKDGDCINTFSQHRNGVMSACFSPDGKLVASGGWDKEIFIWNPKSLVVSKAIKFNERIQSVNSITFLPNGTKIAIGCSDQHIKIVNLEDGKYENLFRSQLGGYAVVKFNPNGQILSGASGCDTKLFDLHTKKEIATLKGHSMRVISTCFSSDGKYILTGSIDEKILLWNVSDGQLVRAFDGHSVRIKSFSVSDDGAYVVGDGSDNSLRLWDINLGRLSSASKKLSSVTTSLNISPDSKCMISSHADSTVKFWSFPSLEPKGSLKWTIKAGFLFFYKKAGLLLSDLPNQRTVLLRIDSSIVTQQWKDSHAISSIEFSPNTSELLLGYAAKTNNLKIKNIELDEEPRYLVGHSNWVNSVRFSKDGSLALSGSDDSTAILWNVKSGRSIMVLKGHTDKVTSVALSANQCQALTASQDRTIKLWDYNNGNLVKTFIGHERGIYDVDFIPGRKNVISASRDNMIKMWSSVTGKEIASLVTLDSTDYLVKIPNNYFKSTPRASRLIHYTTSDLQTISFDQLDAKFNRPDKVLRALGSTDNELIDAYANAYFKRIKRLKIDTTQFRDNISAPTIYIVNRENITYEQDSNSLSINIIVEDSVYSLSRLVLSINGVPTYGLRGITVKNTNVQKLDTSLTVPLSNGINNIEISAINANGTESYRKSLQVKGTINNRDNPKLYFIGIGVDKFTDKSKNLSWSVKDITDLAKAIKEKYNGIVEVDTLLNGQFSIERLMSLKQKLSKTSVNDKVVIAYSGHGLLTDDYDFYLSTSNVDFQNPINMGVPYDLLENLLDSIPCRQRLIFIDACHSGEIDKEEVKLYEKNRNRLENYGIKGTDLFLSSNSRLGMKSSFELMQELFVNVEKNTGSIVISASGGLQFALEADSLRNGVFTHSILKFISKNQIGRISELATFVSERVNKLTAGMQRTVIRRENLVHDWNLW